MKQNHISQQGALKQLAERTIDCETGNYGDYIDYCEFNELDPRDIRGVGQSYHSYALALIGLGMEFVVQTEHDPEVIYDT